MTTVSRKITISPPISPSSKTENVLGLLMKGINEIPPQIEMWVKDAISVSKKIKDRNSLFLLYIRWGYYWHRLEEYEKADKYYSRALKTAEKTGNERFIANIYNNIGLLNIRRNKPARALHFLFKTLSFQIDNQKCAVYSNIGTIFFSQKKYEKALMFYENALDNALINDVKHIFNAYINVGVALQHLDRYDEAVVYYQKSLEIIGDTERHLETKAACFENFGEIRLEQKQYTESLQYLNQAIEFYLELKQSKRMAVCFRSIGKIHLAQEKYADAYDSLQKSLLHTRKQNYVVEEKETLEVLIQYCKETDQWKKCSGYQDQLIKLQSKYFYPERKEKVDEILAQKEEEFDVLMEKNLRIEQQNQRLQQYNRELKQYAFIVAHDLKEPLCNITGFSTLLNSKYKNQLNKEVIELLKYIEGGAHYMHNLLEDLLKYTTLYFDEDKVTKLNTNKALQKILTQLQPSIESTKATIEVETLPNISIEPKHFQWLMIQLIENALKFRHPDKPCHIHIHTYKKHNRQYIEVKDNGIGIEAEQRQKIFLIFQRLHKQNYDGTGIGLAICKKIISLYNGEIGLQSKVGEGTSFFFSLPIS
ncbi:MAG: tetratricopeptide repeat protein [Chitinophagales bacterium]